MRNWLKRLQIKGFVAGALVTVMLSGTFVMANPAMREVIFGVSVRVNGALVEFDPDSRPFIMDGRTFLPVRTVADIFGADVGFDAATNTVLLTGDVGITQTNQPTPLDATMFETTLSHREGSFIERRPLVNMLGVAHLDALLYSAYGLQTNVSRHNLNGQYARLTGILSEVDGFDRDGARIVIIGDGQELLREEHERNSSPLRIDLDVSGIHLLTVEVMPRGSQLSQREIAFVAQLHR